MEINGPSPNLKPLQLADALRAIAQFRVGQILQALSKGATADGLLKLQIGAHEYLAQSKVPVEAGKTLTLQVASTGRIPELRVLDPVPVQTLKSDALRQALPRMLEMTPALSRLLQLGDGKSAEALPPELRNLLQNLARQLPTAQSALSAEGLKQAIAVSGLFPEARLLQDKKPAADLKTALQRIAAHLRAASGAAPRSETPPTRPPPGQPPTAGGKPDGGQAAPSQGAANKPPVATLTSAARGAPANRADTAGGTPIQGKPPVADGAPSRPGAQTQTPASVGAAAPGKPAIPAAAPANPAPPANPANPPPAQAAEGRPAPPQGRPATPTASGQTPGNAAPSPGRPGQTGASPHGGAPARAEPGTGRSATSPPPTSPATAAPRDVASNAAGHRPAPAAGSPAPSTTAGGSGGSPAPGSAPPGGGQTPAPQAQTPDLQLQVRARAEAEPAGRHPPPPPDTGSGRLAQEISRQVEGALSRIQYNQLSSLPQEDPARQAWQLDLALRNGEQLDAIQLRIQEDRQHGPGRTGGSIWTVNLTLDLSPLGPLQVRVSVNGEQVSSTFWAENPQTAALIGSRIDELRRGFESAGLEVGKLACHRGKPAPERNGPTSPPLLDENV